MASLSRKARLQRCSWQLLEDLAFCIHRHQRLAELAGGSGAGGAAAL